MYAVYGKCNNSKKEQLINIQTLQPVETLKEASLFVEMKEVKSKLSKIVKQLNKENEEWKFRIKKVDYKEKK